VVVGIFYPKVPRYNFADYSSDQLVWYLNNLRHNNGNQFVVSYDSTLDGASSVALAYAGALYSPITNRIYFVPYAQSTQDRWLSIYCDNDVESNYGVTGLSIVVNAYYGGVYAYYSTRMYLSPYAQGNQGQWHYINSDRDTTVGSYSNTGTGVQANAYIGGCYDPINTRVYFAPYAQASQSKWQYIDDTNGAIVDYNSPASSGIDIDMTGYQYAGTVYSTSQNRMYFVPNVTPEAGINGNYTYHYLDNASGLINYYTITYFEGVIPKYLGGRYINSLDKIYYAPSKEQLDYGYIRYNCADDGIEIYNAVTGFVPGQSVGYMGAVYNSNSNKVYYLTSNNKPNNRVIFPILDCTDNSMTYIDATNSSAYNNTALDGVFVAGRNMIFLIPNFYTNDYTVFAQRINCNTDSVELYAQLSLPDVPNGYPAYAGGVYNTNGYVFMAPLTVNYFMPTGWAMAFKTDDTGLFTASGTSTTYQPYYGCANTPDQKRVFYLPGGYPGLATQLNVTLPSGTWEYLDHVDDQVNMTVASYLHGATLIGETPYMGGVVSPTDHRCYLIPYNQGPNANWHYIDLSLAQTTTSGIVVSYANHRHDVVDGAYIGGTYDSVHNRIYLTPAKQYFEDNWHYIDCALGTVVAYAAAHHSYSYVNNSYYSSTAVIGYAGNGAYSTVNHNLYLPPAAVAEGDVWDFVASDTNTVTSFNVTNDVAPPVFTPTYLGCTSTMQHSGVVEDPINQKLYYIPAGQAPNTYWYYTDCKTEVTTLYKPNGSNLVDLAYAGGCYMPSTSRIYMAPYKQATSTTLHYINCSTMLATGYNNLSMVDKAYFGAVYHTALDRVYYVPFAQSVESNWHYIASDGSLVSYIHGAVGLVKYAYVGGVYDSATQRIYFTPNMQGGQTTWHYVDSDGSIHSYRGQINSVGSSVATDDTIFMNGSYLYGALHNLVYMAPSYQTKLQSTRLSYIKPSPAGSGTYPISMNIGALDSSMGAVYNPILKHIYFVPYGQSTSAYWYYIDCVAGNVSVYLHGMLNVVANAYAGAAYSATQNRIYFAPNGQAPETHWHYIDCVTQTVVSYANNQVNCVLGAYEGAIYSATQNRIYFVPAAQSTESTWHYVDCDTGLVVGYQHGMVNVVANAYKSGCISPTQDRLYFAPYGQAIQQYWHYLRNSNTIKNSRALMSCALTDKY
jgi:hypothetical protein